MKTPRNIADRYQKKQPNWQKPVYLTQSIPPGKNPLCLGAFVLKSRNYGYTKDGF